MATNHLTPEEKKELKKAKETRLELKRAKLANATQHSIVARKKKQIAELEKDRAENMDIVKFLGAAVEINPELAPSVPPIDHFIEGLSKQPLFIETIGEEIDNPKISKFLSYIGKTENPSFTECAKKAGLTQKELATVWRDRKVSRAYYRIVNRMEEQADKVVDDSMGQKKACRRCDGLKRIEVPEVMRDFFEGNTTAICPECDGVGYTLATGSAPHAQMIWEKMGWSKARGGISVNLNMSDHMGDSTVNELEGIEGEIVDI
tara:strand:+ start:1074 stop:1859 length:786 start_codon:yes stop_codon:yes gene_type:complete